MENYVYQYELSNHLNTAYNTYAPVRAFRTGVFCCSKNYLKNSENLRRFFQKAVLPREKGGGAPPTFQRGRGENVEANRRESIKQLVFQKFYNTVLHNEACDAHKELHNHRAKEITFSDLTLEEARQHSHSEP